jgi:hypothetical protein
MSRSCQVLACAVLVVGVRAVAAPPDPLASHVTIYRDSYGVPHIVGENEEATFFGYGYAQAQDHLERMMLQYRDAQGLRAEVLGFKALGDGYLHFIPYEYRWDGDYLQRREQRVVFGTTWYISCITPRPAHCLVGLAVAL